MADDSDEMESFDLNDEDLRRAYNPTNFKKNKMTKEQSMLGVFADSDDDDDENNGNEFSFKKKSNPISFVSSKKNKKDEMNDENNSDESDQDSNDDDDEEIEKKNDKKETFDQIILDSLNETQKEKKPFIRKHSVFQTSKQQNQQKQMPNRSFNSLGNKKVNNEIGTWEKHTKGIGQKLMEKMGWEKGKGIGKDLQGRAVPVEAVVRKGKAAVGAYGAENKDLKLNKQKEEENEDEDEKGFRPSHVAQWRKDKNKKVNYNAITPNQLLEMAANNPQKLKKIEQMLDLNERKSKQKESNSEMKTSKIKIIDMTGKEQRVMHGYESLSQMNRQSNLASEKKANTNFDLPELVHNLDLLVNLTEDKILNFDKKLKHTEDVIVNMEYEEKRSKERVKIENEQLDNLKVLLAYIEECEKTVLKQNVTIEELIELFQNLQKNYADEFIIFNLTELAIPLLVPVIKRKMNFWNPLNEFDQDEKNDFNEINFCYDIFSELKSFLNETNYNLKKSNTQIINPYHRIIWEAWMPPFRRIISKVNIRKYSIETVDLINGWSSLLPRWILENICEQIILPKLTNEVDQWNPLTDTIPIHLWILPWLPVIKDRLDSTLFPTIRFKLSNALTNWHPSDVSAKAILLPWKPPVFSAASWDTIMCRSIMPKLDIVLNEELVINPNRQAIEPFQWVMSWFELMPIDNFISLLERSFFPKWLQALHLWLNSTPDYNEVSKWYLGWKSLFNEKIVQHPSIKSKLSQGLMMMNRSVSGAPVSLPPQQQQQSIPTNKTNVISKTSHQDIVQSASMPSISSFKDLIERKAAENNILFVQVQNRFKEGKQVYRFGNLNVYIDRNVVFMLQNGSWIPASINEILQKAL